MDRWKLEPSLVYTASSRPSGATYEAFSKRERVREEARKLLNIDFKR